MLTKNIRHLTAIAFGSLILSNVQQSTAEPRVETGKQLEIICAAYLNKSGTENENALARRDECREYLAGFVEAFGISHRAELNAEEQGTAAPGSDASPCFTLPDYLSFSDFAHIVVDFLKAHREYESRAAYQAAAASLAGKYPCRK